MAESEKAHPVRVFGARGRTEASLAIAWLEERGIRAWVEDTGLHEALDGAADILAQGTWIVVSSERAKEAEEALAEFRAAAPAPEDGSEE